MKKIVLFLCGIFLLLLSACRDAEFSAPDTDEGLATFHMGLKLPEMQQTSSRAFSDQLPDVNAPLWVVVFDEAGFLVESAKATGMSRRGDVTDFDVTLHATSKKRILHFILNYSDEQLPLEFGHESQVIGGLSVDKERDVYWQRMEMPSGLTQESIKNMTVPMVRNFAKISVQVDPAVKNFKLDGFYVVHRPTSGSVAPYAKEKFAVYDQNVTYESLKEQGYRGMMPDNVGFEVFPESSPSSINWIKGNLPAYLYEHPHTFEENSTLFVLVKGTFKKDNTSEVCYYKIDLVNENKVFYHVLRNFEFVINITSVTGKGMNDPVEAYRNASSNNMAASVSLKNLLNISNGSAALYVSYIDTVLVTKEPVKLKYKLVTGIGGTSKVANDPVILFATMGDIFVTTELVKDPKDDSNGWRTVTITPKIDIPLYPITQSLVLFDKDSRLSREVVYEYRPPLQMYVTCDKKKISLGVNHQVPVSVKIPKGITEKFFPLTFRFETQANDQTDELVQYLSPAQSEDMAVRTGASMIQGFTDRRTFYYEKVLDFDDYSKLKGETIGDEEYVVWPCTFVTNSKINASTVHVFNKYFNTASDGFSQRMLNGHFVEITDGSTHITDPAACYGDGRAVKIEFIADEVGTYSLSSPNSSLEFNPSTVKVTTPGQTMTVDATTVGWDGTSEVTIALSDPNSDPEAKITISKERTCIYLPVQVTASSKIASDKGVKMEIAGHPAETHPWSYYTKGILLDVGTGLKEKASVTFSYTTGNFFGKTTYEATTAVGELAKGTVNLSFNKV